MKKTLILILVIFIHGCAAVPKQVVDAMETQKVEIERVKWWFNAVSAIAGDDLVNALPVIGGVAGFINSFFFSGESTPTPIKFDGSLKLEGTIENIELLITDDFILNSNASPTSQYYIPVNDLNPIGVFNLVDKPIIQTDICFESFCLAKSAFKLKTPLTYVLNSSAGTELVSMEATFTWDDRVPSKYEDPVMLEKHVFYRQDTNFPDKIVLKLEFLNNNSKNNSSKMVVLKTYPVEYFREYNLIPTGSGTLHTLPKEISLNEQDDYNPHELFGIMIAQETITAGNNFHVNNNLDNVVLMAGEEITLTEGFHAKAGTNFYAMVADFKNLQNGRTSNSGFEIPEYLIPSEGDFYIKKTTDRDFRSLRVEFEDQDNYSDKVQFQNKILSVYPNPNSGEMNIYVNLMTEDRVTVELFDLNGNLIASQEKGATFQSESGYTIPFSVNSLKEGLYLLRVTSGENVKTERILIAK